MQSTQYTSSSSSIAPVVEQVLLPTQVIEKPVAIHEEIRRELVEEIQPVINVEKLKTEVHQVTQPLFDKEVRPVSIEQRTLATEVLPEVLVAGRGMSQQADVSSTRYLDTATVVVEKPAMFMEVEKKQIIEEIQPVIYKETIVPEVIQQTKPIYQKIVEGPVYSQTTLAARGVPEPSVINPSYVPDTTPMPSMQEKMMLPTQIVEKPVAIHEEIRKEVVQEIQPVINVEKLKTEVHQVTQPLFDREVRPVAVQQRTLATEVLPEVLVQGRGVRSMDDVSSTAYQATNKVVVEKPAQFIEVERTQIIEEVQPVIYKETVVPHVIKETKPVYQKIVEGPVYTQQTLPARQLSGSGYTMPAVESLNIREVSAPIAVVSAPVAVAPIAVVSAPVVIAPVVAAPMAQPRSLNIREEGTGMSTLPVSQPIADPEHHRVVIVEDTVTTTTTSSIAPVVGANMGSGNYAQPEKQHKGLSGLFHHGNKNANHTTSAPMTTSTVGPLGTTAAPLGSVAAPLGTTTSNSQHTETALGNGQKVVEDFVQTTSHTQRTVPSK